MKKSFNEPKRFGEILDHTFHLSKNKFIEFAKIFLIIIGPIILLDALIQFAFGMNLVRDPGTGSNIWERIINTYAENPGATDDVTNSGSIAGLFSFFLYPVAIAATVIGVNHIQKGEDFSAIDVIKQAFSRFWPILGSNILFGLITFGLLVVSVFSLTIFAFTDVSTASLIFIILIFFGALIGVGLILSRLSFYLGFVVLEKKSPGFGRSWELSKGRTWGIFGLYFVLILIMTIISGAVEASLAFVLGASVLMLLINNVVLLFTSIILSVGYAVIFFDLKTRRHGDDLKDMLDDYKGEEQPDNKL